MNYLILYLIIGIIIAIGFEFLYDWVQKYEILPALGFKNRISICFFWPIIIIIFLKTGIDSYKKK